MRKRYQAYVVRLINKVVSEGKKDDGAETIEWLSGITLTILFLAIIYAWMAHDLNMVVRSWVNGVFSFFSTTYRTSIDLLDLF